MKLNLLCATLVGVLMISCLFCVGLAARYYFSVKQLQHLQGRYYQMNQTLKALQSLAVYSAEYGKRNPAIEPILKILDLKQGTNMVSSASESSGPANP